MSNQRLFLPAVSKAFRQVFADDFERQTLAGWTPNHGVWANAGGYMTGERVMYEAWNMRRELGSNVIYEGTLTLDTCVAAGLVFRASADGESSYDLTLDVVQDLVKISRRPPYQVLGSFKLTVLHHRPYRVKVLAYGSVLEAYVDGVRRVMVTDNAYSVGHLGVLVYRGSAHYDDLQAWALP
jgi:levanbiose-producing levanase